MSVEKDRRHWYSLTHVLTLLGLVGGLAGVYAKGEADSADTKRRVTVLEQGEQRTHQLIRENSKELKRDVKETKDNVNLILQEIRSMQAVERERERARLERNGR